MQKVMKAFFFGYSTNSQAYRVFNKRTKIVMESINVKIDDAITKVGMVDDEERSSTKEPIVKVKVFDIKVEGSTPKEESTPMNLRMETRSTSRTSSPLTPWKFIFPSLEMMKSPHQRSHHQE